MCKCIKVFEYSALLLFLGIAEGGTWSRTGNLNVRRKGYAAALLTDGKFLIGGASEGDDTHYDIWDPATGKWLPTPLPSLPAAHHHSMFILLPNGKVLYMSNESANYWLYDSQTGWSDAGVGMGWSPYDCATLLKTGEVLLIYDTRNSLLYDYQSGSLTPTTGSLNDTRDYATETLLPNGDVLLAGGDGWKNTSEFYNRVANVWTNTSAPLNIRRGAHTAILLPSPWNQVLIAGGNTGLDPNEVCELYDLTSKDWTTTGDLNVTGTFGKGMMVLLPSGKPLLIGGEGAESRCEVFDPDSGKWFITSSLEVGRSHITAVVLQTGKVLVASTQVGPSRETAEIYDPSDGKWAIKPSLNIERGAHTVTLLPIIPSENCSTTVLIVGGKNDGGVLDECELYNYTDEEATITDALVEARAYHTATLLASGKVLVAGGEGSSGTAISSSEIYTIGKPGSWASAGDIGEARFDHTATLLANGDVLVTGGEDAVGGYIQSCEIYSGGSWTTPGGVMMATPRARHTAVMLLNGDILVIGGQTAGGTPTASCEIWSGGGWGGADSLNTARYYHTATVLQSGKVLVIGGKDAGGTLSSCEVYDPDSNKWYPEGSLNAGRYYHNATLLYSGLVFVAGGKGGGSSCELWDPAAEWDEATNIHKWKVTGSFNQARTYHSSVLIPDSMPFVLAIGGKGGVSGWLNSIEEFDLGLGYRSDWQSTITNYKPISHISGSNIKGTLFRGVSEADGGNYCHIASSDHPIMSFIRVGGGNWQGNGGGALMYIPRSTSWSDTHTVVQLPSMPAGYYRLWAITNGIPTNWYKLCPAGTEEKTGTKHKATGISVAVYPNPAIRESHIVFSISHNDSRFTTHDSRLTIHDISGRLVRSLPITEHRTPNTEITWDRKGSEGRKVKSGIYFYHIHKAGFDKSKPCNAKDKDFECRGKFVILK